MCHRFVEKLMSLYNAHTGCGLFYWYAMFYYADEVEADTWNALLDYSYDSGFMSEEAFEELLDVKARRYRLVSRYDSARPNNPEAVTDLVGIPSLCCAYARKKECFSIKSFFSVSRFSRSAFCSLMGSFKRQADDSGRSVVISISEGNLVCQKLLKGYGFRAFAEKVGTASGDDISKEVHRYIFTYKSNKS